MDKQRGRRPGAVEQGRSGSSRTTQGRSQALPSFRELLPPHLHEAIDSSQDQTRDQATRSAHTYAEGFDELASRYHAAPLHIPQSGRSGSDPYATRPNPSLPSFSEIQGYAEEGQYSSPASRQPAGYAHAESDLHPPYPRPHGYTQQANLYAQPGPGMQNPARHGHQYSQYPDIPLDNDPSQFGVMSVESMDARNKRRRGNLPKPVTDILRAWFHDHLDHPYPSEEDKQMFIARTGLTISQISNWFINARRRQLPALRNQVRNQDSGSMDYDPSMTDFESTESHESSMSPRSR